MKNRTEVILRIMNILIFVAVIILLVICIAFRKGNSLELLLALILTILGNVLNLVRNKLKYKSK